MLNAKQNKSVVIKMCFKMKCYFPTFLILSCPKNNHFGNAFPKAFCNWYLPIFGVARMDSLSPYCIQLQNAVQLYFQQTGERSYGIALISSE